MQLTIRITCDNAAFEDDPIGEIERECHESSSLSSGARRRSLCFPARHERQASRFQRLHGRRLRAERATGEPAEPNHR